MFCDSNYMKAPDIHLRIPERIPVDTNDNANSGFLCLFEKVRPAVQLKRVLRSM